MPPFAFALSLARGSAAPRPCATTPLLTHSTLRAPQSFSLHDATALFSWSDVEKRFSRLGGPAPAAFPDPAHRETAVARALRETGCPATPGGGFAGGCALHFFFLVHPFLSPPPLPPAHTPLCSMLMATKQRQRPTNCHRGCTAA